MRRGAKLVVGDYDTGDIVLTALGMVVLTMRIGERVFVRSVSDDLRDASDPFEVNADLAVTRHRARTGVLQGPLVGGRRSGPAERWWMMARATQKQMEIPGAERETNAEIDELAGPYTAALYERQRLQLEENQLREQLGERMRALGVPKYRYVDDNGERFMLTADNVFKLRCKKEKDDGAAE